MKENNVGCLILHGFAGTRQDIAPLVNGLIQNGYEVSVPLLPGHETDRKSLSQVKRAEWIRSAENAFNELQSRCEKVIVIGFSMGGLIGINLCENHEVSALIMINTPIYYWNVKRIIMNLLSGSTFYFRKYFMAGTRIPLHALLEFVSLLNETKPMLMHIDFPSMIIQTLDDDTVNPRSLYTLCTKVRGPKYIMTYPQGGHMVFQTQTGKKVCQTVCTYIRSIVSRAALVS